MFMKSWIKEYLFSLRKDLLYLLLVDVFFLLVMELVLRKIPAPFPVFVKIGDLMVTLAISFMASFIFYFVQVHMPDVRHKANVYPCVAKLFHRILINEKALLKNYVGAQSYEELTEDMIKQGARSRDVNVQDAPLYLAGAKRNANWIEYGCHQVDDIDKYWEMMMKYSSYLDSECISILADIKEDNLLHLFRAMHNLSRFTSVGQINGIDNLFLDFWGTIKEQEKYYNDIFAIYYQQ